MRSILLRTFLMVAMGSTSFRRPRPSPVGAVGGSFRVTAARGPCGACGSAVSSSVVARPVNGPVRVPVCPPDGWARTVYDLDNHGIAGSADRLRDGGHTSTVRSAIPAATFITNAQRTRSSPAPPLPRRARAGPGARRRPASGSDWPRTPSTASRRPARRSASRAGRGFRPRRPAAPRPRPTCAASRWAGNKNFREREVGQFRAAVYRTVHNACLDYGRKELRHQRRAGGSLDERYEPDGGGGPVRRRPRPLRGGAPHRCRGGARGRGPPPAGREPRALGHRPGAQRQLPRRRARAHPPRAARRRRDRRAARHQHRQRVPAPPPRPDGTGEDPPCPPT